MNNSDAEHVIVKVIGIGAAEIRALESMDNEPLYGIEFIALETEVTARNVTSVQHLAVSEETRNSLCEALNGADLVILVAGIGDSVNKRAFQCVANIARNLGVDIVGIAILPSLGDDKIRRETADDAICEIIKDVDWLIVVPNEDLTDICNPTTGLQREKARNAIIIEAVSGIIDKVKPGSMMDLNFDYHDLKSLLPSKYPVTFGVGKASGINRAEEALSLVVE